MTAPKLLSTVLLLGFALAEGTPATYAQQSRRRPMGEGPASERFLEARVNRLKEELKLSDEQTQKVRSILEEEQKQMATLRDRYPLEPGQPPSDEARREMMEIRQKTMDSLKEVLSEEQMNQYKKLQRDRMQHFGEWKGRRPEN
ncbi:MAG: hypothetical protein NZV14_00990 [Bryobacteraceae bacterium]|nr:hypothetical protein [Bryobacteraceae bacterium]MDW8376705.1 hypothetical protein [Bryobacterales bacterium]